MVNSDDALRIAYDRLRTQKDIDSENLMIVTRATREEAFGWVFFWNDRRFIENGDSTYALSGNVPVVVLRKNGQALTLPWLYWKDSLDSAIEAFAASEEG